MHLVTVVLPDVNCGSSWPAHRHGGLVVLLGEVVLPFLAHGLALSDHLVDLHLTVLVAHLGCLHICTLDSLFTFHPQWDVCISLEFIIPAPNFTSIWSADCFGQLCACVCHQSVCLFVLPAIPEPVLAACRLCVCTLLSQLHWLVKLVPTCIRLLGTQSPLPKIRI